MIFSGDDMKLLKFFVSFTLICI